jgi:NADPH-dependent 2,4-dienoyl-CoA reductase/sulfur reductase-like enzyme
MNFNRVRDEIIRLDASAACLYLASGKEIHYDRLLIAAGSVARSAGWPLMVSGTSSPGKTWNG